MAIIFQDLTKMEQDIIIQEIADWHRTKETIAWEYECWRNFPLWYNKFKRGLNG